MVKSDTNNVAHSYMISSSYSYLIIIYLHTVIWYQVSHLILILFKQIYLTHRTLNGTTISKILPQKYLTKLMSFFVFNCRVLWWFIPPSYTQLLMQQVSMYWVVSWVALYMQTKKWGSLEKIIPYKMKKTLALEWLDVCGLQKPGKLVVEILGF